MHPKTRPTLSGPPTVRAADGNDAEALATFHCSAGRWFQDEVQAFINNDLPNRLLLPNTHGLLFHHGAELIAVGAHQPSSLLIPEEPGQVDAAHLLLLAISQRLHTAQLSNGARLSDYSMRILIRDAIDTHYTEIVFAIVAIENQRSLTMCERNGLSSQSIVNRRYARATGRFT